MASARVVIVGRDEDLCVRMVSAHLRAAGAEVTPLSEHRADRRGDLSWDVMDEADGASDEMTIDGVTLRHSDITAVLNRSLGFTPPAHLSVEDRTYMAMEWQAFVSAWIHRVPCRVVNRLPPAMWFSPLLGPLEIAGLLAGTPLSPPEVTVAAVPANHLLELPDSPLVYAPVSQGSRYPIGDVASRRGLQTLAAIMPVSVRRPEPAAIVRVVVVGPAVYCAPGPVRLDAGTRATVAEACLAVARSLELVFCEFAVGRSDDAAWECHYVNALPVLETLDARTRRDVALSLSALLLAA